MSSAADIDSRRKVGIIVPSANPAVEPEMRMLLPLDLDYYVSRFPVMKGLDLSQRNAGYLRAYHESIYDFGALQLSAISIALTGASYNLLRGGDLALCGELSEKAGVPVATASCCVQQCLTQMKVKRLALVSPYPSWLTQSSVTYWQSCGIALVDVVQVSEDFRAYEMTNDEVVEAVQRVSPKGCDAVLLSGTGAKSIAALTRLNGSSGVPVLSSNLCVAWWLTQQADAKPASHLSAACPQLAASPCST